MPHASRTGRSPQNGGRLELAKAIFEYLEIFHNRQRRPSLGMVTPIEHELGHSKIEPGA